MTLSEFLSAMSTLDPMRPVVFETQNGPMAGGYHLTEFRFADWKGIDCGGQISRGSEVYLQLFEGNGGAYMTVQKVIDIAARSLKALPQLAQAPLRAEVGTYDRGLRVFVVNAPVAQNGAVHVHLGEVFAACKALERGMVAQAAPRGPSNASQPAAGGCCA